MQKADNHAGTSARAGRTLEINFVSQIKAPQGKFLAALLLTCIFARKICCYLPNFARTSSN
jgi:hypothetical protein